MKEQKVKKNGNPYNIEIPRFFTHTADNKLNTSESDFFKYLKKEGFRIVRNNSEIQFVRVFNNIIYNSSVTMIKKHVIDYVDSFDNIHLSNLILKKTNLFKKQFLDALEEIHPFIYQDTKDTAYFYYKNGLVTVTKDGIQNPIPYGETQLLIWEHQLIERAFNFPSDDNASVFAKFVYYLSNLNTERYSYLHSIIGYGLHQYRTSADNKAVILNDEEVSDQPEGGNGKTLLVNAMGKLRKLVIKDGKNFDSKSSFLWSDVDETTGIVLIDDVNNKFNIENLFSTISNGFNIQIKFKNQYHLRLEKSPVVFITTNNIIRGASSSFMRRQYNVDIYQYFSNKHTPKKEFGHIFFDDWDNEEWAKFDFFMLYCVRFYLDYGVQTLPENHSVKKEVIRATSESFYFWIEENITDFHFFTSTKEAKTRFIQETGQMPYSLGDKKFLSWIKIYCEKYGYQFTPYKTTEKRGFYLTLIQTNVV